jgi:hypothetical protein
MSLDHASELVIDEFHARGFVVYSKLDLQKFGPDTVIFRFLYTKESAAGIRTISSLQEMVRCSVVVQKQGERSSIEIKKSDRSDDAKDANKGLLKLRAKLDKLLSEIVERIEKLSSPVKDAA